jgi:hypothetical protein
MVLEQPPGDAGDLTLERAERQRPVLGRNRQPVGQVPGDGLKRDRQVHESSTQFSPFL